MLQIKCSMQLASDPDSTHTLKLLGFLLNVFTISPLNQTLPFNCVSQKRIQMCKDNVFSSLF